MPVQSGTHRKHELLTTKRPRGVSIGRRSTDDDIRRIQQPWLSDPPWMSVYPAPHFSSTPIAPDVTASEFLTFGVRRFSSAPPARPSTDHIGTTAHPHVLLMSPAPQDVRL
ncbi:hypothetical protein C8Q70DRAFT_254088 [Cubamyces menziesii]|nr:hypothetical protein C8Q70DRAFT_254088 [Cubamyces menziesii]